MKVEGIPSLLLNMDREVRHMEGTVQWFVERYNVKNSLTYLFNSLPMIICLQTDNKTYHLTFTNEQASYDVGTQNEGGAIVQICGSNEAISELLLGKQKLRYLISMRSLTVNGSFRTILLLESLFYLTSKGDVSFFKLENLVIG
jgi:hypothetical protein